MKSNAYRSASQIAAAARKLGVPERAFHFGAEFYALPSQRFLTGSFSKWVSKQLRDKPPMYDAWDCAVVALTVVSYALESHRRAVLRLYGDFMGLGLGELWLDHSSHALLWAAHAAPRGGVRIVAYEPQLVPVKRGYIVKGVSLTAPELSPQQWQSCSLFKAQ